jgi:hypothetical protein
MQLDPEDVFAGTFGRIALRFLLFVSAVWIGSMVGGAALAIGSSLDSWRSALSDIYWIWASPAFLVSTWLILNAFVLLGGLAYFMISESDGILAWGILAGLESFFVVAAWASELDKMESILLAWISWLVLLVMIETGVWLIRQMLTNRWARQLAILNMENSRNNAEREANKSTDPSY